MKTSNVIIVGVLAWLISRRPPEQLASPERVTDQITISEPVLPDVLLKKTYGVPRMFHTM